MRFLKLSLLAVSFFVLSVHPSLARSGPMDFSDMAEKLLPSVVNISTTQTVSTQDEVAQELQIPEGAPFEDFFKNFMEKHGRGQGSKEGKQQATSLGSGFVINSAGYIVTNNHVIQDADEINVILQDDTNLSATVVGRDKKTDLALLKVTPSKPLPAVNWGSSDKARVGEWVLAIGNPYGLGGTVTTGIISARARDINSGPYDDYLQTDAPINRGNSGGPMFNMDGDVIGINTAIFSPTGGSVGIGFAVPSEIAKGVIDQLRETGHTRRGWLGVHIQAVTPEIAESLGLPSAKGAMVSSVSEDGPAAKAKIESGDVILTFDGKEIGEMRKLPRIVAETGVDKMVDMTFFRKGKTLSTQVRVGELESHDEEDVAQNKVDAQKAVPQNAEKVDELGITALPLSEPLRKRFGIEKSSSGVVVLSVKPSSVGAEAGMQVGDVISEASQHSLKTVKELEELAKTAKKDGKPLLMLVDRKGDLRFVAVSLSGEKKKK